VIACGHGLAHLVHQAFATSLDQTFAIAVGPGLIAAITVLTFLRPTHPHHATRGNWPAPVTAETPSPAQSPTWRQRGFQVKR
jgi:hypothetical protein